MRNTWKWPLCYLRTTQAQISLRISAGWSGPSLSAYRINWNCTHICRRTENAQIRRHGCACWSGPTLSANCIRAFFVCWASSVFIHFQIMFLMFYFFGDVVVVRNFNATRHPRHIEAAAVVRYMYLYSLAVMDHPCTLGAAVCHQAPPCPLYTKPKARWIIAGRTNALKIVSTRAGFEPTISRLQVECASHWATQPTILFVCLLVLYDVDIY